MNQKKLKAHSIAKPKKKIIKKQKLTIDVPENDSPIQFNFSKGSPKHRNFSTLKPETAKPKKSKSKVFLFPDEKPKVRNSVNSKPKTPLQKKKQPKLIKRPKTATNAEKLKKQEASDLKQIVTQVSAPNLSQSEDIYNEHLFQTFQGLKIVRSLPPVDLEQLKQKRMSVPRRPGYENKKTVIFDLDETLVHCCENLEDSQPDVVLPVKFPTGEVINAGINIRPYATECLKEANKNFEVFVFTASHPCYANVVLDYLDPTGELIHQRFFRENCINMNGIYIKDLRIFTDRKMSDIVIIDNASYSYAYQIDNGVPIISWHDNRRDQEMLNLIDYLQSLVDVDDIREVNFETFHLRTFYDDYLREYLIQQQ